MKVLTAEQMRHLDRATIDGGVPGIELMRHAGAAVYEFLADSLCAGRESKIVIVAGKGNNGGDGFRVAELVASAGGAVTVLLAGEQSAVSGDARTCLDAALAAGADIREIVHAADLGTVSEIVASADIIVDALFGTGLRGEVSGLPADIIDTINNTDAVIVAVDIPSGVDAGTGGMAVHAVQADYTVTFGCPKVGNVIPPGEYACGEVSVVDIGLSAEALAAITPFAETLSPPEAALLIPERRWDAHKGTAGRVFVIAGSAGKTGAAALTSMAVLRAGAGLVTLGCPESLNDILEVKLTEPMTLPLPEVRKKRCLSLRALGSIRQQAKTADVLAIGPGLGVNHETTELVRRLLADFAGRAVVDADGLNAFAGRMDLFCGMPGEMVLTPHPGELSRLLGIPAEDITDDPVAAVKAAQEVTGKTVLLKGAPTLIAGPEGKIWVNGTGNEALATAGTGDVLTGIIAGLAAQGLDMFDAAVLGAYLHGLAGEAASGETGIHAMIAGDVLAKLSGILRDLAAGTAPEPQS